MFVQADGKILVTGYPKFTVARYNSNGSLDTTFDTDGIVVTTTVGYSSEGHSITVQPDGKILVAGRGNSVLSSQNNYALVRYNPNGSLDTTFDTDGIVTTTVGNTSLGGNSVTIQTDGKIIVAGLAGLVRYNPNGSLDMDFGTGGIVTSGGSSTTVQVDGKILVVSDSSLIRYNPNGSLDMGFGSSGIVATQIYSGWGGNSITIQPDGRILVVGSHNYVFTLARYNSNGSLDTTFDTDGIVTTDLNFLSTQPLSVAIQADGKILVAGLNGVLVRYNSDGSLDLGFDSIDTLANTIVSTESNKAVVMASAVNVIDAELYAQGNYNNAHLILQRHGTSNVSDVFGINSPISFANGVLSYSGTAIGTVTQSNGKLDLTFNSNATQSVVTTTLRNLTYKNVGNGAAEQITLDWTFSDGNTGSQGAGGIGTVTGTSIVNIADLTPPSVSSFSPTTSATNVALNSNIVLTFSEAIQRGTGNIVLKNSIGTVIATYDAATSTNLSFSDNKLTINPSADLAPSTRYIVDFANGVVKDLSGNVFAGRSGYQFDTGTSSTTNINHLPTGDVSLYGDEPAKEGWSLLVGNNLADEDGLGVISYQWLRNNVAVPGETDFSYTLTSADVGKTVSVRATYTDLLGNVESVTSRTTAAVIAESVVNHAPTGSIVVSGVPVQGQTLSSDGTLTDIDGIGVLSGQWFRDGIAISGATTGTYTLTHADVGKTVYVKVSYTDALGTYESVTSNATAIVTAQTVNPIYAAPKIASEVMKNVPEPDTGSVLNYFLASFGTSLTQDVSFNFRTLNGTATAGVDYLATEGQVTLHAGENHFAIPVTIFGDTINEINETFSLEISNPIGFSLPNNALTLIATHTITDNDTPVFPLT
jgi:uncharacterized delta-60 repeat protein